MKVIPFARPAQDASKRSATGQGSSAPAAQLSMRAVTLLELLSVLGSILLTLWAVVPLYPQTRGLMAVPALAAVALVGYSQLLRGENWRTVGLSTQFFAPALRLLALPVLLSCAALLALGYFAQSFHRSTHFALNLLIVPLWGVLQQYVLQGYFYRRIRSLLVTEPAQASRVNWAIGLTACLFAFVHLPNLTLTLLTLLASLVWTWIYERAPNLWALGLSHGLLSLLVMHSLPDWLLQSMSVGYKHFLYQKF